jgi:porin
MSSEQGVELFYNIEVTPWFHLTPDVQVIAHPGAGYRDRDAAVVFGVRGQINF